MRRRDLFTSALAAAAGGCAAQRMGAVPIDRTVTDLDRSMARISDPFRGFVRRETGDEELVIPQHERALLTGSLKSLLMLGTLRDLPVESRRHPELLSRGADLAPEAGRSLYRMTRHMERMPAAERTSLQRSLARDPDLPLRAAEHLDRLAGVGGLGATSRFHLRSIATDAAWRLGHQPVSLFLDETTERMTKAIARRGELSESERSMLAMRMQEEEWDEDSEYEYYEEEEERERPREPRPWGGRGMAIAGGAAGILGLVGGYVGFFWFALNDYGNSSTVGPIALMVVSGVTFVAGLIVMITGLVMKSRQDREWLERNPKPVRRRRR